MLGRLAGGRAGSAGRGHARDRGPARRAAGAEGPVHAAAAPARGHGLGDPPPRRPVRAGVRLRRAIRGAGGGDRRPVRPALRSEARALLDRREGRRDRRLGLPGRASRRPWPSCGCCWSSRRRAASASARAWSPSASASRARRATGRSRSGPIASCVAARRIYEGAGYRLVARGAASQLRPRPGRRDLGAEAVMRGAPVKLLAAAAAAATGVQVGAAMVATRFVVDQAGPASLALLRYAIGFCCLLPFVLRRGGPGAIRAPRSAADRPPRHRPVRHPDRAAELRASLHPVGARGADLRHVPAVDDGDRGRARPRAADARAGRSACC